MTVTLYRETWIYFRHGKQSETFQVPVLVTLLLIVGTYGTESSRDGDKFNAEETEESSRDGDRFNAEETESTNIETHETAVSDSDNEVIKDTKDEETDVSENREEIETEIKIDEKLSSSGDEIKAGEGKADDDSVNVDTDGRLSAEDTTLEANNQDSIVETDGSGSNNDLPMNSHENNTSILSWFRYFLDPFLDEFKDGIYTRTNHTNATDNASVISNKTEILKVINETTTFLNLTDLNSTDSNKKTKFQCTGKNVTDNTNATVKIVSGSRLLQLLNFDKNDTENVTDCLVIMFYAPWCLFCAKTAPHYNALSRAFPQLDFIAVDTAQFSNLLARFGIVSVPNILVFHQSRAAVKFNQTERTLENFVTFVKNTTGLEPNTTVNITDADYIGPIPSVPTEDPDIFLWLAWMFVILYSSFMFVKSTKGQQWITRVRILWQEHQHID